MGLILMVISTLTEHLPDDIHLLYYRERSISLHESMMDDHPSLSSFISVLLHDNACCGVDNCQLQEMESKGMNYLGEKAAGDDKKWFNWKFKWSLRAFSLEKLAISCFLDELTTDHPQIFINQSFLARHHFNLRNHHNHHNHHSHHNRYSHHNHWRKRHF